MIAYRNNTVQEQRVNLSPQSFYQPVQSVADLWQQFFLTNPNILARFAQSGEWWRNILHNTALSPAQKFEAITGVSLSSLVSGTMLGDIFGWLNNLFSSQNISKAENWLRQGQNVAQRLALSFNVFRNSPNVQQQANRDQSAQDIQSKLFSQGYSFGSAFWPLIIAGLFGYIIFKK